MQRGSINNLGFTRADLVNAQDIFGSPAPYQLGHGTNKAVSPGNDDPIPIHESVEQELQVDLFFFLGQVFLLSISVLLGLIMVTHLGPGIDRSTSDRHGERSKSKAAQSLSLHISQYEAKGFRIKRVTSDGEPSIRAAKQELESKGIELNILGRGSHTPHAESAIRHIKNKARSTAHSLAFPLASKLVAALTTFAVHTANMVPKVNAVGHFPAHTAFLGRVPNFARDATFAFGTAGFLQRAPGPTSNSAAPRGDYCIWLSTTHNLAGTHRCLDIDTLREITGDTFRSALLTPSAITRLTRLPGQQAPEPSDALAPELPLDNPRLAYSLDTNRGVEEPRPEEELLADIIPADSISDLPPLMLGASEDLTGADTNDLNVTSNHEIQDDDRAATQVAELVDTRESNATGYTSLGLTPDTHVFSALSSKDARALYGDALIDAASIAEITTCIEKDVWE